MSGVIIPSPKQSIEGALWGSAIVLAFAGVFLVSLNAFAGLPIFWTPADAHHAAAEGGEGAH
ncbi:MAG: hypothetical protein RLZZ383_109 [Pseudomonadota bacterium]|jgi:hypothetical protein